MILEVKHNKYKQTWRLNEIYKYNINNDFCFAVNRYYKFKSYPGC